MCFSLFSCFHFSGMLFMCFSGASHFFRCAFHFSCAFQFSVLFTKCTRFHIKSTTFHKNQQNQVNMCVYMYHLNIHAPHTPPKYKIYLVGLPSVLYKTPGHNERSVLNQLFLLLFIESAGFHTKSTTFYENQQNQVNMCVYMYHLYIHAPPNTTKI